MNRERLLETKKYLTLDEFKAEQTRKNFARLALRRDRTEELLKISGEELPDEIIKFRIEELMWRFDKIASTYPCPVTNHLRDGNDKWDLEVGIREDGITRFLEMRRKESSNEDEVFALEIGTNYVLAMHTETRQSQLAITRNSERELHPAEELFDKIWSPIEEKCEAPYTSEKLIYE